MQYGQKPVIYRFGRFWTHKNIVKRSKTRHFRVSIVKGIAPDRKVRKMPGLFHSKEKTLGYQLI